MDAKAKVVYYIGEAGGLVEPEHATENIKRRWTPVVTLADHESALAELREEKRAWTGAAVDSIWGEAIAEHKLRNLLSQLDALASELELDPDRHPDDFTDPHDAGLHEAAQRIRTLTNSAKDST